MGLRLGVIVLACITICFVVAMPFSVRADFDATIRGRTPYKSGMQQVDDHCTKCCCMMKYAECDQKCKAMSPAIAEKADKCRKDDRNCSVLISAENTLNDMCVKLCSVKAALAQNGIKVMKMCPVPQGGVSH